MSNKYGGAILLSIKKWLQIFLFVAVPIELFFFFSIGSVIGCLMGIVSYLVFSFFLKTRYVLLFPFSFFMFLSMFLYRYLPLLATLIEVKPITYGLEMPEKTFLYEILLFLISSIAFYLASKTSSLNKNNMLQRGLLKLNFFSINPAIIWGMGSLGVLARLVTYGSGEVEYGDVGGKFLQGVNYFIYAPIILLFPNLLNLDKYNKSKAIWVYTIIVFIIQIASNSREAIIAPIAVIGLLFFLNCVKGNINLAKVISPFRLVLLVVLLLLGLPLLGDLSLAMISTRAVRDDVGKVELFKETVNTLLDDAKIKSLRALADNESSSQLSSYVMGWSENYIDNFMLNRYANMRITDQTLYYAEKRGYGNSNMSDNFNERIINLLPTPIANLLGFNLDKRKSEYSRGDLLADRGTVSYIVTSHVGDGLATFGHVYFLYQFIAFYLVFMLLNTFVYYAPGRAIYAPFALMNVFTFLGMFRNANGMITDVSFILRGYWQGILTYLVVFLIVKVVIRFFDR